MHKEAVELKLNRSLAEIKTKWKSLAATFKYFPYIVLLKKNLTFFSVITELNMLSTPVPAHRHPNGLSMKS